MRKILTIIVLLSLAVAAHAQDSLYVYRHGAKADSLCMRNVSRISHSRIDLSGVRHDDYVVMEVSFNGENSRQYLLASLDSVVILRGNERFPLVCFSGSMTANGSSSQKAPRRTSLDGDFLAKTSEVDFFWEEGDKIYVEDTGTGLAADSVVISDTRRTADFYFKSGNITGDDVTVYYPGQTPLSYNEVRVTTEQTQQTANDTKHIGVAGDCGTAVATKDGDTYRFQLTHKAAYLCFLPYIGNDLQRTVLKKITVRSDSAIAGVFTLNPEKEAIVPKSDTTHVITLSTGGEAGFVLPQRAAQTTSAYMVIAPQNGSARLTCEFTVFDTLIESEGVYTKTIDLAKVEPNMVYVIKANCNNYVVDLGLPVKFLNHNYGAFAPEEYGGYFAFAELEDKGNYTTNNYTYQNTPFADMTKNIRLTDMDVAHVRLGGNFSMPTSAELNMLVDSCSWTWDTVNSIPGYKVSRNGNCIFIPAAGYRNGTGNNEIKTRGTYRSSQLTNSGLKQNWYLNFNSNSKSVAQSGQDIWLGESVRPVVSTGMQMTDGSLLQVMTDSVQWRATQLTAKLYGTLYGYAKAKNTAGLEIGFVVGKTDSVTIANGGTKLIATVTGDGAYNANFAMPKDTVYYYRAYVQDADGNIDYANTLQFGRCYVDLGLPSGTKWANINVGATRPDEDGGYYAWGETATKSTYTAANHVWYDHSEPVWLFPERNLRNTQATRSDAAAKNWGGVWMLPTYKELKELCDNCTFTQAYSNGMIGTLVKSNLNGNSFFMPRAGWRDTGSNTYTERAYLTTSELRDSRSDYAWHFNNELSDGWFRSDGITARAIYKTNAKAANGSDMYVRTLPAYKYYNGTTERDTLRGVIRGLENAGSGNTIGIAYWKDGAASPTLVELSADADGYVKTVVTGLDAGATYHYAAYVNNGTETFYGETLDITTVALVDLGLSVKWANVNIGAESEGAGGDFYRWGATVPYRYATQQNQQATDISPDSGFDIATNTWGANYRMPSKDEYQELIDNTERIWTTRNGFSGYLFTSTKEGYTDRSVFIPAAGYFYDTYHNAWNANADYWTSTVNGTGSAYDLNFTSSGLVSGGIPSHEKHHGFSVRAVQDKLAYLETRLLGRNTKVAVEVDTLKAYIHTPSGSSVTVGFELSENAEMTSSQQLAAGTASDGTFQYAVSNLQKGKVYYYRAYASDGSSTQYGDILSFELLNYVDLGLPSGTLWANMNVGANTPEAYGDYFAYAETSPKESYTQDNYKYYQNGSWIETGYDIAGTEYDAATVNMGELWCSPTYDQCNELLNTNYVTWELVTVNGYYCCKVTSKMAGYEGNYIYLPRGGRRSSGTSWTVGPGDAVYAPSSRYNASNCYDWYIQNNNSRWIGNNFRYYGYTMRPVINKKNLQAIGDGTFARIQTTGCNWVIGAPTATLRGSLSMSGSVSGTSYGFIVGGIDEVDTNTPAAANVYPASNLGTDGTYSIYYTYDGSAKYFRAYLKVGDTYYLGDIKSVTAATLLSAEFKSDGTIFNGAPTTFPTAKTGSPAVSYNSNYKRYEVNFNGNSHANYSSQLYSFDYRMMSDFRQHLADGHSIEAVMMLSNVPTRDDEADIIADYQDGGSGIGIHNKEIWAQFYLGGYKNVYSGITPEAGLYYHVVAVYDKTYGLRLYVDGVKKDELETSDAYGSPNSEYWYFTVSGNPVYRNNGTSSSSCWPGTVVFARIYDEPLNDTQVQTLYENLQK